MSKVRFKVSINPQKTFQLVKESENAELIYEELNHISGQGYIGILVFEKYYMRVSSRAGLIVIIDNTKGETEVRVIATASSKGMIFDFDWGAGDDFVDSVKKILEEYIL